MNIDYQVLTFKNKIKSKDIGGLGVELEQRKGLNQDVLGDIVISIAKVKEQAVEYGHSFERELAYMAVHGFYHLMGYDHIDENDKVMMRQKEENVLNKLNISK